MSLLAIDMGSSSCKAVVHALDGRVLGEACQSYTPKVPAPSWAELPADTFWQAFRHVTRILAGTVTDDPVEALGISSHGETFVPVDHHNQPLSPAILNMVAAISTTATAGRNFSRAWALLGIRRPEVR